MANADVMRIEFRDAHGEPKTYYYNATKITNLQAKLVYQHCGRTPYEFLTLFTRYQEMKAEDFEAIWWLMRTQAGDFVSPDQVSADEFDIMNFMEAFADGANEQAQKVQREREEKRRRDEEAGLAIPKETPAPTPDPVATP